MLDRGSSSERRHSTRSSTEGWKTSDWQSACNADSSDDEGGLDLQQPFSLYGNYSEAPRTEGRAVRPALHSGSASSAFQAAFDQQQSYWQRKLSSDHEFRKAIEDCASIQSWMEGAIARNELNVETIRFVASSCATKFLEAIGYIEIVEGTEGSSIQWTPELLDAFREAGEWYSATKPFWFGQGSSIAVSGASVLLEMARSVVAGSSVDKIKLALKAAQLTWQGTVATPMAPLLASHEQSKNVKGQELASIPYMPNVSSIDYKLPIISASGESKLESVPYAQAKDVQWGLDLIQQVIDHSQQEDHWFLDGLLETEKGKLASTVGRLEEKTRLSRKQKHKLRLAKQRLELVSLASQIPKNPDDPNLWNRLAEKEGLLKKELALAEIAATFNSAPAQSAVRAARYKIFGLQAAMNIAGAGTRLGHCIPHTVVESAAAMAGNVTWAGSQIMDALGAVNVTETSELVAECTGFNPWGFALEVANFGLTLWNPIRYTLKLPEACANDHIRKVVAYSAALMLQPHGKLATKHGAIDPDSLKQMLTGRMWRVLDCTAKALEADLHCTASALMTHIIDFAPVPTGTSHPYKWLLVQFEALKTGSDRRRYMLTLFFKAGRRVPDEVDFLLEHHKQIVEAIELVKQGQVADLLDAQLLPTSSIQLLRSGLTIAAGGETSAEDHAHWKTLMTVFGDIEARSFKNGQFPQKAGQALAKRGIAGTAAFTFVKSVIDFAAAVSKSCSTFEHDTPDVIAKAIQILGGAFSLGTAFVGYLVSYCYWQFILEKNRQRQAKLNDKFAPPNSSILDPDAESYFRGFNPDRCKGVVTNFKTLLAHQIDNSLINREVSLTYETNAKEVWGDVWAQINAIDLDLNARNLCKRLQEIVHPDETLLDAQADEILKILSGAKDDLYRKLEEQINAQKTNAPTTTTVDLAELFVDDPIVTGSEART